MKWPSLGLDKLAAGGRAAWNAASSVGGKLGGAALTSKKAVITATTLGVGTLASTAGYFAMQGKSNPESAEVAAADDSSHGSAAGEEDGNSLKIIPDSLPPDDSHIPEAGASEEAPLGPPPASLFNRGGRRPSTTPPDDAGVAQDQGLGAPGTEEPSVDGQFAPGEPATGEPVADGGAPSENPADAGGEPAMEAPPDSPRVVSIREGAIRPAAGDEANGADPGAPVEPQPLNPQADAPLGESTEPAMPAQEPPPVAPTEPTGNDPAADATANEPAPPALRPVPNVIDSATPAAPPASAPLETPAAPPAPRPAPDRIVIPNETPGAATPGGTSTPGNPRNLLSAPPRSTGTRMPAPPNLAPVPETMGEAGLGAGAGAAAGAAAGLGAARLTNELLPHTPSIARPTPGPKELEGAQTPCLHLEKFAPAEIQVGKPAVFEIKVKNTGRVPAHGVIVTDHIPAGTRLLDADPEFQRAEDGTIRWQLGTIGPGQESLLAMRLLPEQEGEIGSVAQVSFQSQASVRTVCTRPQISLQHQTAQKVLVGDDVVLAITVANSGTGAATDLIIEETVPEGLAHPVDRELEYNVGTLRPGETKRVELKLKAAKAGLVENVLVARSGEQVVAEDRLQLEVLAPALKVGLTGPKVRYLDRQATYSVSVSNPGTASAKNIELAAYLPRGLKFVAAENQGQYDAKLHAVFWGLAELPVGATGAAQLSVLPIEPGQQAIRVTGTGDLGVQDELQQGVVVETQSELQFSVADVADPIEVGSETTYDIRVTNRGTRAATNVQVLVQFPPELQPVGGEGPSRVSVRGAELIIEPITRLNPDTEARYRIQVRGVRAGDPRIRVQLVSGESPTPVTKEESTRVYADE